jgi:branched-chain amino acid transport system permease protein
MLSQYWTAVTIFTGVNVLLGWALWLPIWSGQLILAQAGYAAVGAYASAMLSLRGVPFPLALLAGCLAATLVALLVAYPTLRLPPLGVAILTLASAEMIRVAFTNFELVGARLGLFGIPVVTSAGLVWLTVAAGLVLLSRLSRARLGRALVAVRDDPTAAGSMGVHVARYRLLASAASGFLAGLGGVYYAHYLSTLAPELFGFSLLLQISVVAFLGGRMTYWGPVAGAIFVTLGTELLRAAQEWRLLIYGAVLVLVMLRQPRGLVSAGLVRAVEQALASAVAPIGRRVVRRRKAPRGMLEVN